MKFKIIAFIFGYFIFILSSCSVHQTSQIKNSSNSKNTFLGRLEFKTLDESINSSELEKLISNIQKQANINDVSSKNNIEKINTLLKEKIPKSSEIVYGKIENFPDHEIKLKPFLVNRKNVFTVKRIIKAELVEKSDYPYISIILDQQGTKSFEKLTQENLHKFIAILVDGEVIMTPYISDVISTGNPQIGFGYYENQTKMKEAKKLLKILEDSYQIH